MAILLNLEVLKSFHREVLKHGNRALRFSLMVIPNIFKFTFVLLPLSKIILFWEVQFSFLRIGLNGLFYISRILKI